jgi:putative membrane-bound dehydrogenase-like protein
MTKMQKPLEAEESIKHLVLPKGFHAELFITEKELGGKPICMTWDERGRLWCSLTMDYPNQMQPKGEGRDKIVVCEDTDGDGRADKRTVFYEGFNYITGIEVGFGGVWVISPPGLYFVPIADGADKPAGPPELIFDGFGYKESRHNLANGFTWGPDGWLYAGHGRTSPSDVGRPGTPATATAACTAFIPPGACSRISPTGRRTRGAWILTTSASASCRTA